jgi:hypothetical protein
VNSKCRIALLTLLLAPSLGFAQSNKVTQALAQAFTPEPPFNASTYKPLSGHERWHRWVDEDGRTPEIYVDSLGTAVYSQVIESPDGWPRTWEGYGRRTGSHLASSVIENTVHESFAAAEGTDPRYFACGCKGLFPRTGHALKMTFLTYNRSGHQTLDLPMLAGAYGSSMIKTMWYPDQNSPLVQGVQSGHIEVGIIGAENILREFSPEFKRLLHLRPRTPATKP